MMVDIVPCSLCLVKKDCYYVYATRLITLTPYNSEDSQSFNAFKLHPDFSIHNPLLARIENDVAPLIIDWTKNLGLVSAQNLNGLPPTSGRRSVPHEKSGKKLP